MYAVIKTGGKQYKVAENDVIKVEKLSGDAGQTVKLNEVLALENENKVTIGEPLIKDAVVSAEILEQKKDDKVIIFKKKRRHNYRRKNGHRQKITVLRILDVSGKGGPGTKKSESNSANKDKKDNSASKVSGSNSDNAKSDSSNINADKKD